MAVQWTHILEKEVDIDVGDGGEIRKPYQYILKRDYCKKIYYQTQLEEYVKKLHLN